MHGTYINVLTLCCELNLPLLICGISKLVSAHLIMTSTYKDTHQEPKHHINSSC